MKKINDVYEQIFEFCERNNTDITDFSLNVLCFFKLLLFEVQGSDNDKIWNSYLNNLSVNEKSNLSLILDLMNEITFLVNREENGKT